MLINWPLQSILLAIDKNQNIFTNMQYEYEFSALDSIKNLVFAKNLHIKVNTIYKRNYEKSKYLNIF